MSTAIRIEHLSKAFGPARVLDDLSLEVEAGELFFLLGPSGCGKTTLLRCLAGFCQPERGELYLGGRNVTRLPPDQRATGMVFQSYALWPHMTVAENVGFGLEIRAVPANERTRRVRAALDMVRMAERAAARPGELSGGQQQRVALARALVIRPQALLLDEPLSNLDAQLRLEMRGEIRRICKQSGITALYVTHDRQEALAIADRLAVLDAGRVRQCGCPRDVYRRPGSRFVAGFIGETNFLAGAVTRVADGRTVVATALGDVTSTLAPPPGLHSGRAVTLSLRPEAVHLGDPPSGTANAFEGVVHATLYLGELAEHLIDFPTGGVRLKALALNPRETSPDTRAERARVWFSPADVVVLTE